MENKEENKETAENTEGKAAENNTEGTENAENTSAASESEAAEGSSSSPPEKSGKTKKPKKEKKSRSKEAKEAREKEDAYEAQLRKDNNIRDILELRRTAKEVKRHAVVMRFLGVTVAILTAIVSATYGFSYFYNKYGSFTIKVNKYDMVNQGLSLSEYPVFEKTISTLNADILYDMTNISGNDIPDNVDMVNGCHNGENYIAYTFYLHNAGNDTITYESDISIDNVTKGVDEAIRVAVYKNGEKTVYGKTKADGSGIESDCDREFSSATKVMHEKRETFEPQSKDKYTVIMWLEGNDPECLDDIVGGTIKLVMNFKIVEDT